MVPFSTKITITNSHVVDGLIVDIEERYDVIVKANQPRDNCWIRAKTLAENRDDYALAVLRYDRVEMELPKTKPNWGRTLNVLDLKPHTAGSCLKQLLVNTCVSLDR